MMLPRVLPLVAFLIVCRCAAAVPLCAAEVPAKPSRGTGGAVGTFGDEKLTVNKVEREYRLIVPQGVRPQTAVPLVFAFHGFGDSKDLMAAYSQLPKLAEKEKFILVFPQGRERAWPIVPLFAAGEYTFFDRLYDIITSKYNVDLNRVYVTGMSNGAFFSTVLAVGRSDKIAAIAPHSGGVGVFNRRGINAPHKYAVFIAHGADDKIVAVDEGRKLRDAYQIEGHAVEYLEVPNHGHLWAVNANVNAKMWKFFMDHPRVEKPGR